MTLSPNMVFTQSRGFVFGESFGLQIRSLRCRVLVCRAADTASLAMWFLFGKLFSVATLVCFGEKRCRKNLPLCGLSFLRLPSISKLEWLVVFVIVAVLVLLLAQPTPHWRETSSQSCHLCGNCRVVIQKYRWWELDSDTIEPVVGAQFSIPDGHVHEWWQYSSTFSSWSKNWAADNSARYKDGRLTWTP